MDERQWIEWPVMGPPGPRYYMEDLVFMLGLEKSTINGLIADGRFPEGFKASPQARPWWSGQVLAAWFFISPFLRQQPEVEEPKKRPKDTA